MRFRFFSIAHTTIFAYATCPVNCVQVPRWPISWFLEFANMSRLFQLPRLVNFANCPSCPVYSSASFIRDIGVIYQGVEETIFSSGQPFLDSTTSLVLGYIRCHFPKIPECQRQSQINFSGHVVVKPWKTTWEVAGPKICWPDEKKISSTPCYT